MKKLVLIAALVAAGMMQAASVTWSVSNAGKADLRVWCFMTSTISQEDAVTGIKGLFTDYNSDTAKAWRQANASKWGTTDATGGSNPSALNGAWGATDEVTGYAVIFDVSDINASGATKYMLTDQVTVNFETDDNPYISVTATGTWLDLAGDTPTPGGDSDVPEPTSGVLMLVGAAMVALKRKQR